MRLRSGGTIVGMVVATLGVAFLFHRRASRWLLVQVTALLAGVALYYLLFSTGEPPAATERFQQIGKSGSRRLQLWQVSLEMLWANLWLGAGPMHFAWPPYQLTGLASPHSALMQWLAEWGLPSTLMMTGLTTWGGWYYVAQEQVRHAQREAPNVIGIALV
ncbi:O-antigen ligase family protein, partial [Salinibacter ruber]|uniref:O-antigen ligase family protein n=1 Tax=Salinibacter ruber TaxID=146919 RepID=UPI00355C40D3